MANVTINLTQLGSIARQGLAILGVIFGVLTQSVTALHLPVAVSTWIGVAGATIIAIQHYLSGTTTSAAKTQATITELRALVAEAKAVVGETDAA
jgi:hypothetical protein